MPSAQETSAAVTFKLAGLTHAIYLLSRALCCRSLLPWRASSTRPSLIIFFVIVSSSHILANSDVVFPEKYFLGNFPENFWKFSEEKENITYYLIYQKKSYEPQYQYVCSFVYYFSSVC